MSEFLSIGEALFVDSVRSLFPNAKMISNSIENNNLYYDFDVDQPFNSLNLKEIEDLINNFLVSNTNYKNHFIKIKQVSAICSKEYLGQKQLQRIHALFFKNKEEYDEYLNLQEEIEKNDHKKLGKEMELYMYDDLVGKGLPIWLPNGEIIRQEIEKFAVETERKAGYVRVSTPNLAKKDLYVMSGHIPHYKENMYPEMKLDDGEYMLKAMNCPHHHLIFNHKIRSYKDLPLRIAEYGRCYRNEMSGSLSGLLRVRMLSMNDAHIYCTKNQIRYEIKSVIKMIVDYFNVFGIKNYSFRLSLHSKDNKNKYIDEPQNWSFAEEEIRSAMKDLNVSFVEALDEAAFYGPKIDIQYKTVFGREETISTVQLDFAAKKKFSLTYVDKDGKNNNEVYVIHRAPLSTHERFIAFLIELYEGKFPLWLNPKQVKILSVSDKFNDYANNIANKMFDKQIRVEVDDRMESISKKVRDAQIERANYILVVGQKEIDKNSVFVRNRNQQMLGTRDVDVFISEIIQEIEEKRIS